MVKMMTVLKSIRNNSHLGAAAALTALVLACFAMADTAQGGAAPPHPVELYELNQPPFIARHTAAEEDNHSGFPTQTAGFSAYYRVAGGKSSGSNTQSESRIDVAGALSVLTSPSSFPDTSPLRPGTLVDMGRNYAIVALPVLPTIDPSLAPPTTVNLYFDSRGWMVAYLPADTPAVAIWRPDSPNAMHDDEYDATVGLANNLFVVALAEAQAIAGWGGGPVAHADIRYYDWQNPDCDGFVLFTNAAGGSDAAPVEFFIPKGIGSVHPSAAVLITSYPAADDSRRAELAIDGQAVAADPEAGRLLRANTFELSRSKRSISRHVMALDVSAGTTAAGAVLLLYDKPATAGN